MENRIYDKKNGLWYEKQGDYCLPCLGLPKEENQPIGIWGKRRKRYLKQNHRVLYMNLLTSGKLNSYLANIDAEAEALFFRLVEELAQKENVTKKLKADNQVEWVSRMNNIRSRAIEIVNNDIIYH